MEMEKLLPQQSWRCNRARKAEWWDCSRASPSIILSYSRVRLNVVFPCAVQELKNIILIKCKSCVINGLQIGLGRTLRHTINQSVSQSSPLIDQLIIPASASSLAYFTLFRLRDDSFLHTSWAGSDQVIRVKSMFLSSPALPMVDI